jgi:stage II sporulation protein E
MQAAATLAVLGGSITVHSFDSLPWVVAGLGACLLLSAAAQLSRFFASPAGAAVVAAVSVAIPGVMAGAALNPIMTWFWVGLSAVLALVFTIALGDTLSGRLPQAGEAPVPAVILLAAALTGMEGIPLGTHLALRDIAAAVIAMACAYMGGAPTGAAAGGLLGLTTLFSALGSDPVTVSTLASNAGLLTQHHAMGYVVAGMLAGTFRELRKVGVGVAFTLGLVIYSVVFLPDTDSIFLIVYNGLAAMLLFWLIPPAWLARLPGALVPLPAMPVEESAPATQPMPAVMERLAGMSRVFKEVSRTFEEVAVVEAPREPGVGRIFEQASERVCRSCSLYRQCWERDFDKTYQLYSDLWLQIDEEGPLSIQAVPEELRQHCIFPDRVAFTLNYLHDLSYSHRHWERRLEEGRTVVGDYLKNVSRMLDRFIDEVGTSGGQTPPETQPALRAVSGVARLPKRGGHISGDSYVGEPLSPDRYMLALSDGMGVGRGAAAESKQCVTLLRQILRAGFATDVAVKTVNSVLLLHSPEESFATVDLALLDLATGRTEFVKVGAAPSFVKRGSDVTVVKVSSVPVGIINQVQVEPEFRNLRPGDLVVLITDGVWDVCKNDHDKERWILEHLRRESSTDPEAVAESLLARALDYMPEAHDDMTVLVARIDAISGSSHQAERRGAGNWAPVRRAPKLDTNAGGKARREKG